jgi:hypothetical protein
MIINYIAIGNSPMFKCNARSDVALGKKCSCFFTVALILFKYFCALLEEFPRPP